MCPGYSNASEPARFGAPASASRQGSLVIDPALPASLGGLRFTYDCFGRILTLVYHIGSGPSRTPELHIYL
ncbi:hypothetical protein [Paenibacillus sp. S150]|uniref:hypothetical protein n=1 Tax=Paenibacillus sp. S150 TaxID=2749826 RepID=UPI0035CC3920